MPIPFPSNPGPPIFRIGPLGEEPGVTPGDVNNMPLTPNSGTLLNVWTDAEKGQNYVDFQRTLIGVKVGDILVIGSVEYTVTSSSTIDDPLVGPPTQVTRVFIDPSLKARVKGGSSAALLRKVYFPPIVQPPNPMGLPADGARPAVPIIDPAAIPP